MNNKTMNRNTILPAAAMPDHGRNNDLSLGWRSMPAYGEVMNQLVGSSRTDVVSSLQTGNSFTMTSIWNVLSNHR